jgi:hypothetical protein
MDEKPNTTNRPMAVKFKRRRFQFRLRTLLIVVTLFCVVSSYVGWQMKIVMDRKAAVSDLIGGGGHILGPEGLSPSEVPPARDYSIPFLRRWMGDHAVFWIVYKPGTPDDEIRRLRTTFPEATLKEDSATTQP